jgi:hypothetical protein
VGEEGEGRIRGGGCAAPRRTASQRARAHARRPIPPARGRDRGWQGTARNALSNWAKERFSQAEEDAFAGRRSEIAEAAGRLARLLDHLEKVDPEQLALLAPTLASLAADAEERLAVRAA